MRGKVGLLLLIYTFTAGVEARAEPIFPRGKYPGLDADMARHSRQFYTLNARPFGWSLDVHVKDMEARKKIEEFLAQEESEDFEAVTGVHPYDLISMYGEFGDLGFFGGVAMAGTAFEYMVLKRDGAPEKVIKKARERLIRAAKACHVFYVVTGGHGVVARGIRKLNSDEPGAPEIPMNQEDVVPLFDKNGNPLPEPKNNGVLRADNSNGALPEGGWEWIDSCSKDQLIGQMFAMVVLYEAMKDDPDISRSLVSELVQDAEEVAASLMTKRDIGKWIESGQLSGKPGMYDLIIMDADGRPTKYHDLNPASLESWYMETSFNRFNLLLTIGVFEALFHVTGDPVIEEYLYKDLLHDRGFLDKVLNDRNVIDYVYMGMKTNIDDPDMVGVALWISLFVEKDPEVSNVLRQYLEKGWWNKKGEVFTAGKAKQPLWNMLYMTSTDKGTTQELIDATAHLLEGFSLGPYWNDKRINCDEQEIAARHCIAVDGKTELDLIGKNANGEWFASEALDPRIRPPSNFDSRSHPFVVNGGGNGRLLNPGGDLLATYWIGRFMERTVPGDVHLSPNARTHMPVGGYPAGDADTDADTDSDTDLDTDSNTDTGKTGSNRDSGCSVSGQGQVSWTLLVAAFFMLAARLEKKRSSYTGRTLGRKYRKGS